MVNRWWWPSLWREIARLKRVEINQEGRMAELRLRAGLLDQRHTMVVEDNVRRQFERVEHVQEIARLQAELKRLTDSQAVVK